MIPKYDPAFDWATNIADYASKLESVLRERVTTRPTIAPFPSTNVPSLMQENENALANFDKETQVIEWQAGAARDGYLWFDPETLRTPTACLDRDAQTWRQEASKRGRIVKPEEYFKSRHTAINEPPLMVRRGEPAGQFGRREPGTSPLGFNTTR